VLSIKGRSKILQYRNCRIRAARITIFLALFFGLGACQTLYEEAPAPDGVDGTNFTAPVIGTRLTYRTYTGKTSVKQEDWVVVTPGQSFGRPAYGLKSGARTIIRNRDNGNWVATLRGNKKIKGATPDDNQMRHPLWVGKKWISTFIYKDYVVDREWSPVQNFWSVEAKETITVEAGTFEVFRLKSDPGLHSSIISTIWFSPELGLEIKRQWERLEDHYLGAQKGRIELIKIVPSAS